MFNAAINTEAKALTNTLPLSKALTHNLTADYSPETQSYR
jgi:hypothetical protein